MFNIINKISVSFFSTKHTVNLPLDSGATATSKGNINAHLSEDILVGGFSSTSGSGNSINASGKAPNNVLDKAHVNACENDLKYEVVPQLGREVAITLFPGPVKSNPFEPQTIAFDMLTIKVSASDSYPVPPSSKDSSPVPPSKESSYTLPSKEGSYMLPSGPRTGPDSGWGFTT